MNQKEYQELVNQIYDKISNIESVIDDFKYETKNLTKLIEEFPEIIEEFQNNDEIENQDVTETQNDTENK